MISQQTFGRVIDSQRKTFNQKTLGIEREKLSVIPNSPGFASIITGMRRCGKSTLQLQIQEKYFAKEGLHLHFEDPRLSGMEIADFERLYAEILARKTKILFFDEIQIIKGWEIF